jgi:cell division protein FtsB
MFAKIKNYQKTIVSWARQLKDLRVVGLLLFLVILFLVSWSGVKAIETNYRLQKQISAIRQENTVKKLANENLRLENDYFKTSQYLDVSARQDFGLAAPGETVLNVPRSVALSYTVDLPQAKSAKPVPKATPPKYQQNFQAWMDFFFHRRAEDRP